MIYTIKCSIILNSNKKNTRWVIILILQVSFNFHQKYKKLYIYIKSKPKKYGCREYKYFA